MASDSLIQIAPNAGGVNFAAEALRAANIAANTGKLCGIDVGSTTVNTFWSPPTAESSRRPTSGTTPSRPKKFSSSCRASKKITVSFPAKTVSFSPVPVPV